MRTFLAILFTLLLCLPSTAAKKATNNRPSCTDQLLSLNGRRTVQKYLVVVALAAGVMLPARPWMEIGLERWNGCRWVESVFKFDRRRNLISCLKGRSFEIRDLEKFREELPNAGRGLRMLAFNTDLFSRGLSFESRKHSRMMTARQLANSANTALFWRKQRGVQVRPYWTVNEATEIIYNPEKHVQATRDKFDNDMSEFLSETGRRLRLTETSAGMMFTTYPQNEGVTHLYGFLVQAENERQQVPPVLNLFSYGYFAVRILRTSKDKELCEYLNAILADLRAQKPEDYRWFDRPFDSPESLEGLTPTGAEKMGAKMTNALTEFGSRIHSVPGLAAEILRASEN